jgi:hypothetical protein
MLLTARTKSTLESLNDSLPKIISTHTDRIEMFFLDFIQTDFWNLITDISNCSRFIITIIKKFWKSSGVEETDQARKIKWGSTVQMWINRLGHVLWFVEFEHKNVVPMAQVWEEAFRIQLLLSGIFQWRAI